MIKLNLTYVDRKERTSAKTGKPFTSLSIKATQYGDKFLSGFGNKDNANWQVGQEVEVAEIIEKPGKNKAGIDVVYLNFEMPKASNGSKDMEEIKSMLFKINMGVSKLVEEARRREEKESLLRIADEDAYPTPESEGLSDDMANFDR